MRFHELMKETWKEGLGKKKKKKKKKHKKPQPYPQKNPKLGLFIAWKMRQETLYHSKYCLGTSPYLKLKKNGSIAMMSYLKTLVYK